MGTIFKMATTDSIFLFQFLMLITMLLLEIHNAATSCIPTKLHNL